MSKNIQFSVLPQFLMKAMPNDQVPIPHRKAFLWNVEYLLIALSESASCLVLSLAPSPGFLLIAANVQATHEGIKTVWLSQSQPESEVWELFPSFAFMVLTWFILTNLPSDMVCYLYFKHITLDPTGTLVLLQLFPLPYTQVLCQNILY